MMAAGHAAVTPAAVLQSTTSGGDGCPAGSGVAARLGDDGATLTLTLPGLAAATTGARRLARKHCAVVVTIGHAPGWQVAVGEAQVPARGSGGDVTVTAYRQGETGTAVGRVDVGATGATGGSSAAAPRAIALSPTLWSACGDSTVLVVGAAAKVAHADAKVELTGPLRLRLTWRPCAR